MVIKGQMGLVLGWMGVEYSESSVGEKREREREREKSWEAKAEVRLEVKLEWSLGWQEIVWGKGMEHLVGGGWQLEKWRYCYVDLSFQMKKYFASTGTWTLDLLLSAQEIPIARSRINYQDRVKSISH